jgi:preprotein translocase subunit SecA
VLLRTIDNLWMDHLDNMDHLRDSVRLRAYGQRDPLVEYKNEGQRLFRDLLAAINSSVAKTIYKVTISREPHHHRHHPVQQATYSAPQKSAAPASNPGPAKKEPGRNDPCWCGAKHPDGRPVKYKRCHGK